MTSTPTSVKFFDDGVGYWDFIDRQIPQREANYQPLGGTGERACANCQFFIAPMSCTVVESFPDAIVPNGLSDEWRAKVSQDMMMSPVPVFIVEAGESSNSPMKRERGQDYPPEDFAIIPDVDTPSDWKLRLTSSPGELSGKQIEAAIDWLGPHTQAAKVSQATGRIKGAIRRIELDRSEKTRLLGKLDNSKGIEVVIHGAEGKSISRTLYESIMEVVSKVTGKDRSPEPQETRTAFKVVKDAHGAWRWLALVSNNFRDKDNPPEIFEAKAHEDFINYLDNGGQYPELWLWHTPGTKFGKADWADYQNGFLIMSGTVDASKAAVAEFLSSQDDLGVSHGYSFYYSNKDDGIIGWYRSHEVTVLPHDAAANPWASIEFLTKEFSEMGAIETGKRQFLVNALGEDVVKGLENGTQDMAKVLSELGVEYKAANEPPDPNAQPKANSGPDDKDDLPPIAATVDAKAIAEALTNTPAFTGLTDTVKALGEQVKALEAADDAKIAAFFRAKSNGAQPAHVASQSDGNVVDGKATTEGPSTDWFDETVAELLDPQAVR